MTLVPQVKFFFINNDCFPVELSIKVEKTMVKTLVIKSIYQITIYLFDKIYIYIFLLFAIAKTSP